MTNGDVAVELKLSEAKELIQRVWAVNPTHGFFLYGPTGVGKTAMVKTLADPDEGTFTLYGHSVNATEINGILAVDDATRKADWIPLGVLPDISRGDPESGVIIIEEPNLAPPSIQGELMRLIYARSAGSYTVPPKYRVVGCGNRPKDKAAVNPMPAPLRNRWTWIYIVPDVEDWVQNFAVPTGIDWTITAFLRFRPTLLQEDPPIDGPCACGRTWERANDMIKSGIRGRLFLAGICGAVGAGAGKEYIGFRDIIATLPNMREVAMGSIEWVPPKDRLDLIYAGVTGLIECYRAASRKERITMASNIFKFSKNLTNEVGFWLLRDCYRIDENPIREDPQFKKWCTDNVKYLKG